MNKVLTAQQINKSYRDGLQQVKVLQGVDLTVSSGEMLAIVGSSGSGKSTLLHILGSLDIADSGSVQILGEDLAKMSSKRKAALRNQQLGFIYQFHHLLMDFTALENVTMPLLIKGVNKQQANTKALAMLQRVGLAERASHKPAELSGGERQRVAIARALVAEPALVLADEPTGNLDQHTAESIYQLLRELNQQSNTSFIIVTHDIALAKKLDKYYLMREGCLEPGHA
ncbi:lipoprotein-releasing ABC transporter ATP-binding protein LolD [Rheinheimera sp. MMS21-TC3]|uniref:lipoprotein-releasing ABC transporter ATP-binding protein LolD n=1 Tax=Rheinheimera sp. MMS21-TC3 TaxID=3072790 RepID=UPI0028C3E254|nr:lipoprotein-releasing ABC transporter ATP-binding protein LolD [Rheinheimera sp. MMS21-TC3]WNO61202.1 lipoprotein-releasing ABC transporter ATP-binding protein LolD [Rheinheimera sp. MMS21-TC3]